MPIQYALSYPRRLPNYDIPHLDLVKVSSLVFESINYEHFPCLTLALEAGKKGGTYPAVLCAADEIAVEMFLNGHIKFTGIAEIIADAINSHHNSPQPTIDEILAADNWARERAMKIARKRSLC